MKTTFYIIMFAFIGFQGTIGAQTHIWTGNGGNNFWGNPANWNTGTAPNNNSDVLISDSFTVLISGSVSVSDITLDGNAELTLESDLFFVQSFVINTNASLYWTDGSLHGDTLENQGLIEISELSQKEINSVTLNNSGVLHINNSGILNLLGPVAINNETSGTITIQSNGGLIEDSGPATVNNEGLIQKIPNANGDPGVFYMIFDMNNSGIIDVAEDQTFLFLVGSQNFINLEQGILTGDGTYDITANFVNEGTVAPGSSGTVGSLDITNNFSLNGGSIAVDLAGVAPNEADLVEVFGSPIMDGTVDVNLLFTPQIGDEFTIISWNLSGSSCNFPQFTSTALDGLEYTFETFCNANDVTLRLVEISVLGLDDFSESGAEFYVYPNPVSNKATFVFSSEGFSSEETTLSIYNYLGQRVLNVDGFTSETNTFQRGNLPAGLYFASIAAEGQVIATTQFLLD